MCRTEDSCSLTQNIDLSWKILQLRWEILFCTSIETAAKYIPTDDAVFLGFGAV
jgi:hypothetical protein